MQPVEPSQYTPKWVLPHLAHAGAPLPPSALTDDGAGPCFLLWTYQPDPLLPILVGHHLTQYPDSIPELSISDLSLGLHFWCIGYPLILWFNIPPSWRPQTALREGMI
ncbi:hypothetical protein H5410_041798 [Solanum commersonii]|uniref:Uncharacterized protein n=1 Tax=Solanum commersonii TaxID=4109 RepID=A0A9J5XVL9_SOLCO|nr:hypothetical protein H5410_041798 [Solanum commersonii]